MWIVDDGMCLYVFLYFVFVEIEIECGDLVLYYGLGVLFDVGEGFVDDEVCVCVYVVVFEIFFYDFMFDFFGEEVFFGLDCEVVEVVVVGGIFEID